MSNGIEMMMKKNQLSPRDQEMLSAYLDGQLSSGEIARLQARLQQSQQMQIALEELRMTRAALRSLPRLRAPRNFTLTPKMAKMRDISRRPAYPAFAFASLVASLLLVLVFVSDRMNFIKTNQTAALQSAAQATQMEEMVQTMVVQSLAAEGITTPEAEATIEMEAPMMAAQADESSLMADSTAEESLGVLTLPYPEPSEELSVTAETEPTESAVSKIVPEETSTSVLQEAAQASLPNTTTSTPTPTRFLINGTEVLGIGGGAADTPREVDTSTPEPSETPEPSPTPSPTFTPESTPLPSDTPLPTETPLPTDTPVPTAEQLLGQPPSAESHPPQTGMDTQTQGEQVEPYSQPPARPSQLSHTLFLAVEIVLGLLAIGCALIFVYLYRKSS